MLDFLRHGSGVQWMSAKLLVTPFSRCMLDELGETE